MAQYTLKIPELANAELKLTVEIERLPITDDSMPSYAELRPSRVVIHLGGEEVYSWQRPGMVASIGDALSRRKP